MPLFDFNSTAAEYDKFYETQYGKLVDKLEKRLVKNMLSQLPRGKALEIGCGTGHWTKFFLELGFNDIIGIDIAENMLKIAKQKLPNTQCLIQNAEKLDFPYNSFDYVFAITVLEFVDNLENVINEVYRVLKPDGYFLVGALNLNSELGKQKDQDPTFKNARFFTPEQLYNILKKFGEPQIDATVLMWNGKVFEDDEIFDLEQRLSLGAFLVGLVQKKLK